MSAESLSTPRTGSSPLFSFV